MESKTSREDALAFLRGIEARHNQLLDELESLSVRIEKVLGEYLQTRDGSEATNEAAPPAENL